MELVISTVAKAMEYTVRPVGRQLGYLYYYNDNIKDLSDEIEKLKEIRELVEHMVDDATGNAEGIELCVRNWSTKVDKIIKEFETTMPVNEGELANEMRSSGLCSNVVQRHQLSRKAKKMVNKVVEMIIEGNFTKVSYTKALSQTQVGRSAKRSNFLRFQSRQSSMKQIMDAVMDKNVRRIGVYGMGGVGKTMLVEEILRSLVEKEKLFDGVVMSTISQKLDVRKIQGEIGDKLGLKFEQESLEGRASKLCGRLKMEKILVVLDDIWEYIDLERIGIPSDDKAGCKIIFTSRDKHILLNDMYCGNNIFEIKVLQADESWNLFKNIAGEIVERSDYKRIAKEIVKGCVQLPIAITTVANALKGKELSIWEDASHQLLKTPAAATIRGMNEEVYSSLKLSYNQLQCEEAKSLFLLCSTFPEDFPIKVEELHVYAMGMGLLHGVDTLAQARRRITKLVDDLVSSSLIMIFESDEKDIYAKMHDLVRDVAIQIASNDNSIRTLSYVNKWEEEKNMSGDYTAVYIYFEGLEKPPKKLMLPKVELLILSGDILLKFELPDTFFEEMQLLKVVKLKGLKISPTLLSFCSFTNLRSLHLVDCELDKINVIGELKELEALSFRGSDIIEIPTAISQLTKLKMLDLSFCLHLKVIPPYILSRLTNLEELNLEHSFVRWEADELKIQRKNATLYKLKYLTRLSTLNLCIQDKEILPKNMFSREFNLERFKIIIGCDWDVYKSRTYKMLYLNMGSESHLDDWIKALLKKSEELNLKTSVGSRDILLELHENGSSHLKHLGLFNNTRLQHLIHDNNKPFWKAFYNLESLTLSRLNNLENIIKGHVHESPFNKLRIIKVEKCHKLKNLFVNFTENNGLKNNIEKIKISLCELVAVIIEGQTGKIEFNHLLTLKLNHLPSLTSFCSKMEQLGQGSFDTSAQVGKGKTSPFFSKQVSVPNLENLIIKRATNLKMICDNEFILCSLPKLRRVEIAYCDNLEKLFPSNAMSTLKWLKILRITNCKLLQGIFEVQQTNHVTQKYDALLPRLSCLEFFNLPNLKYMWSRDPLEFLMFKNIETLSIHQCPKFKRVYSVKVLQQLEHLKIDDTELKEILGKEKSTESSKAEIKESCDNGPQELFSKLKTLNLYGPSLDYKRPHLPVEFVQILKNLEELEVRETFFEEIFPSDRSTMNVEEKQILPLRRLILSKLPKLRHLWKESSQIKAPLLQNLEFLGIRECGRLNSLVPSSSASFRNLINLSIYKCHKLTYLLNPEVAKTLVQLENLILRSCKRMATVVVDGEEKDKVIVFNKLQNLTLGDLPILATFHSWNCIIRFPCLDSLVIQNCPEMKVFSQGMVSTPFLTSKKIQFNGYLLKRHSDPEVTVEDINVIVRKVWENDYISRVRNLFIH